MVSKSILNAFESLDLDSSFQVYPIQDLGTKGLFSIRFSIQLNESSNKNIPLLTNWIAVFDSYYPFSEVKIYPTKKKGITTTFPHQDYNLDVKENNQYRNGKLCLENPGFSLGRDPFYLSPESATKKLEYYLKRTKEWLISASKGELLNDGDYFELPPLPRTNKLTVVAFQENSSTWEKWCNTSPNIGFVHYYEIESGQFLIENFSDCHGIDLLNYEWALNTADKSVLKGMFLRLDKIPVVEEWRLPNTFSELLKVVIENCHEFNLDEFVSKFGKLTRSQGQKPLLILGFPICQNIGDLSSQYFWICISNLNFANSNTFIKGFRPNQLGCKIHDKQFMTSNNLVEYAKTENWSAEVIKVRSKDVTNYKITLIGVGSLGSAIAELLCRSGLTNIYLFDEQDLSIGNLSRHSLNMKYLGFNKAIAMADYLNSIFPDILAIPFDSKFPKVSIEAENFISNSDIVIDCTGMDSTLYALSQFNWKREIPIYSFSMTQDFESLIAFCSFEFGFPYYQFMDKYSNCELKLKNINVVREGLGCWNPVLEGGVEHVMIAAAKAKKYMFSMLSQKENSFQIIPLT
ncbi:MAG: hypothetical protein RL204_59 [Bacteroidota bacterium]|jgi:hypothetical protein